MFGKNSRLGALYAQKQLLLAESELNRAQLEHDIVTLKGNVHELIHGAKSFTMIGSAVGAAVAGIRAFTQHKAEASVPREKPSALRTILKGASLVSSLWMASREQAKARSGNGPSAVS
jgi:hypothetical protein